MDRDRPQPRRPTAVDQRCLYRERPRRFPLSASASSAAWSPALPRPPHRVPTGHL